MSLLMEHMIGLTDTAYLGRVGEVELGASALAGVYYLVIYMLGFGFSIGAQVLIARRNGAQEYKRIGPVFLQGTFFLLLLAALLFTASHLYSPFFLRKLIGSDDVYQATMKYVDWRVYGFFFSFVAVMFRAFYVGYYKDKNPDRKLGCDGVDQCNAELCPDIRKVRITGIGNCRSGDRFIDFGGCFGAVLHSLYVEESRLWKIRAV